MDFPASYTVVDGITPAWAGKRYIELDALINNGDHPRVGGEKQKNWKIYSVLIGSPPRGRGKVYPALPLYAVTRITPAWAGKRSPVVFVAIP